MATAEYDKNNCTRINLKLNNKTDADIIEKLDSVENVQGFIKAIIRNDMEGAREMKHFERKTFELYGARNAGYCFDLKEDREIDNQLMRKLIAERGERFVDNKLDDFCDFTGDLYEDENGEPFAVGFVYDGEHEVPLCWQKLRKAEYKVREEFADLWGEDLDENTVISGADVKGFAEDWERPVDEIFGQLQLIR